MNHRNLKLFSSHGSLQQGNTLCSNFFPLISQIVLYQISDQIKPFYILHCGDTPVADKDVNFLETLMLLNVF